MIFCLLPVLPLVLAEELSLRQQENPAGLPKHGIRAGKSGILPYGSLKINNLVRL